MEKEIMIEEGHKEKVEDAKHKTLSGKGTKGVQNILNKDNTIASEVHHKQEENIEPETVESVQTTVLESQDATIEKNVENISVKTESTSEQVTVSAQQTPIEAGQINITVYKARNIEKKGMFGKADPYVQLTLDNKKAQLLTVKNIIILNGTLKHLLISLKKAPKTF